MEQQCEIAQLSPKILEQIDDLEQKIKLQTDRDIILIAYEPLSAQL